MALARRSRTFVTSTTLTTCLIALASGLACSVILNPRDDVQRCGSATDCDETGDARYEAACVSDPEADIDTTRVDQICVAIEKRIGCNPMNYDADHPLRVSSEALDTFARHDCADTPGVRGCPAPTDTGACADGLVVNQHGFCDTEPNPDTPAINLNTIGGDLGSQDVLDQFCAGFFCDDEYVCNTADEGFSCERCDPDKPYGEGGCGRVFTQGQPSCIYVSGDALDDECAAPDSDVNDPVFGDCG